MSDFPALPAEFIGRLRSKDAMEGATATLHCELSKEAPVEWRKGSETLRAGGRVSLRQDGTMCELEICDLAVVDSGEYSCVCGQERTSATLTVRGKDFVWSCGAVSPCFKKLSCCSALVAIGSFCLSASVSCILQHESLASACVRLIPNKLQRIRFFLPSGGYISGRNGGHPTLQLRITDFMSSLEGTCRRGARN